MHTPGEWKVIIGKRNDAKHAEHVAYIETKTREICVIYGDEDQEANTRLIAAAPDLLTALKDVRAAAAAMARVISQAVEAKADIMDDLEDEFIRSGVLNGFGVRADAAIARAEGGTR